MLQFIDFTPAYLKPRLQICVPHLHKAMSPNVTGDTVHVLNFNLIQLLLTIARM
jgi:hypothetical protein